MADEIISYFVAAAVTGEKCLVASHRDFYQMLDRAAGASDTRSAEGSVAVSTSFGNCVISSIENRSVFATWLRELADKVEASEGA